MEIVIFYEGEFTIALLKRYGKKVLDKIYSVCTSTLVWRKFPTRFSRPPVNQRDGITIDVNRGLTSNEN